MRTRAKGTSGQSWSRLSIDAQLSQLPQVQVLLIHAQRGDDASATALGASWAPMLATFLEAGGVVIAVEGASGTSHRVLAGAGLLAIPGVSEIVGVDISIVAPSDSLVPGVLSPYRTAATSVVFDAPLDQAVIADASGRPVVLHTTVP